MSMKKRNRPTNQWLIFSSLALQIGIIIFVCVRLGEYLDASLSNLKINFKLILTAISIVVILWTTYKQSKRFW